MGPAGPGGGGEVGARAGEWAANTWRRVWNRTHPAPADVVRRVEERERVRVSPVNFRRGAIYRHRGS